MRMFTVFCRHYAPKDSHDALGYVVACADEEALFRWLDSNAVFGAWSDDGEEWVEVSLDALDDEGEARAVALGVTVTRSEYGVALAGPMKSMILAMRGDAWCEVSDLYYGATLWWWVETPYIDPGLLRPVLGERMVEIPA